MEKSLKYYEAYEERYKTAHQKGISWAYDKYAPPNLEGRSPDGEFIYVSVTAPPINFGYAYKDKR